MACVQRLVAHYQSEHKSRNQLLKVINAEELVFPHKIDNNENTVFARNMKARLASLMTFEEWGEDTLFDTMAHVCLMLLLKTAKRPGAIASLTWNKCMQYKQVGLGEGIEPLKTIVISGENVQYKTKKAITLGVMSHDFHLLSCLHMAKKTVRGMAHAADDFMFKRYHGTDSPPYKACME